MKSSMMKSILYSVIIIGLCLQCWSMTPAQTPQPTPTPDPREAAAQQVLDEGFTLIRQGTAESLRAAITKLETARSVFSEIKNRRGEADSLLALGRINDLLGEKQKALACYNQALLLYRVIDYRYAEAITLNNVGKIFDDLGEKQKALENYNRALPIFTTIGNKAGEALTLSNIGKVYSDLGEKQKALEYYNRALPLGQALGNKDGEATTATTLSNIGAVYSDLGEHQKALEYFNQALPLYRALGHKYQEGTTLNNIGKVYSDLGDKQKAFEYYNLALPIRRAVGDTDGEATTLSNIGTIHSDLGDKQKALECFNQALPIVRAVGNRNGEATILQNLGKSFYDLGENQKALEYLNQALPIYRVVGDKSGEVVTLTTLMVFWQGQKNTRFAIYYGKQGINGLQQLRANIQGLKKETQQAFLKSVESNYRYLADLLIAQGRIPEAEQVLAMLKDEEFFQYVRRDGGLAERLQQRTDLNSMETKALAEYTKYGDRLTEIGSRMAELEKERLKFPADQFPQQAEYDKLKLELEDARRVFMVFLRQLADEFGKSHEKVRQIESSLQADLKRWGANNVVVISTIVGEERLNLIVTTSTIQKAYTIELKAVALNKLVQEFRAVVIDEGTKYDPRPLGQQLYDVLVKPLEKDLAGAKADTLLWSLDGTLRYVPMAALWDGKQYLAERYRHVIITLASRSKIGEALAGNKADWQALAAGVSAKWPTFNELAAVPEELRAIVRETPAQNPAEEKGVLPGQRLLNGQFSLKSFEDALGRYRLIHIASHFRFRPGNETNSFLLLGDGSSLTVAKVRTAGSMFDGVELLALSACDTATGSTSGNGSEVESFVMIAQEQGAKAVLGTLWPVADVSTRDLMVAFYRTYSTTPDLNKAEALRQAQLSLLRGTQTQAGTKEDRADIDAPSNGTQPLFQKDPVKPFAHPYYWAPFILIGNWR